MEHLYDYSISFLQFLLLLGWQSIKWFLIKAWITLFGGWPSD